MKNLMFFSILIFTGSIGQAQWTTNSLSAAKTSMGACSPSNGEFWFGGGANLTAKVEIYNLSDKSWEFMQLSEARAFPAAVGSLTKVIFAGGINFTNYQTTSKVDIYDIQNKSWSTSSLSVPRFGIAGEIVENMVFFAGGTDILTGVSYDVVDIYSLDNGTWSTAILSEPRGAPASAVGHNSLGETILIFAGGFDQQMIRVSDRVDIYNIVTKTWSTDTLSEPRGFLTATTAGNKILIAGGMKNDNTPSDRVDIYDGETDQWSIASLSTPRAFLDNAATVCDSAYFAGGGVMDINTGTWISSSDVVDIYDPVTGDWKVDQLSNQVVNHAVVSDGDHLLVAGGYSFHAGGAIANVDIYSCYTTGIEPIQARELFFELYPNPGRGTLNVSTIAQGYQDTYIVRVYTLQGEVVLSDRINSGETAMNLNLPVGTYVFSLTGMQGTQSKILIIQ